MPVRSVLFLGVALLAVPGAFALHDQAGPVGISAAVAVCSVMAVIVSWPVGRRHLHRVAVAAGGVSLAVTAYASITDTVVYGPGINIAPAELIALYLLLAAVARWMDPLRSAVASGAVVWIACVAWTLRLLDYAPPPEPELSPWPITSVSDLFIVIGHFAASAFFPSLAVLAGGVPRHLAHRRAELIAAVRRDQRLELAQDLHDYVAHDLTGIVAQAQSAQFARPDDAEHLRGALARIEEVGTAALDTMDGFVQGLHEDNAAPLSTRGISDVPRLVERFRVERPPDAPVRVEFDDDLSARTSREVQAAAYRVVVEGLTNVRRHGAPGRPVTVRVGCAPDGTLSVLVLNEVPPVSRPPGWKPPSRGGTGLVTLEERLQAVGGRLEAGRDDEGRWRLEATLPATDPRSDS
ncbi:sensor histidine kinase [Nocardiopsis suaedae]|uniref:histidine kinase n=1 Tax=Nocardiopsis suaedae TaxID=3018444 RepID=A0ABT4TJS0_9ACTN|nr:histidine kinase [Nocardiopsis suaedae]MDA2804372.1 histidine kinase [Nocardiopsis suaedae]